MSVTSPCARVIAICDEALGRLDTGPSREKVLAVRERLTEPLRVAVAGRVKAGKSTLVNALLEERIAPTATGECTKVVTWFRHRPLEGVELHLRDGRTKPLSLTDEGMLPETLDEPLEAIESMTAYLSNDALRDVTIIDTPGLASANEEISTATADLLARSSRTAVSSADALIYVVTQDVKADDAEVLHHFRSEFGGARTSAINAVGVLNKADKIGGGQGDPLAKAEQVAERYADALSSVLGGVISVVGLLAETAATDLRNSDAHHLGLLAGLDERSRRRMLTSVARFQAFESDVPPAQRARLLSLLDLFGVARALQLVDSGVRSVRDLSAELRNLSGIGGLKRLIDDAFRSNADSLKAEAGLAELEAIAYASADAEHASDLVWLRGRLDDVRLEPEMHRLNEVWALQEASAGAVELHPELYDELRRLFTEALPEARLGLPAGTSRAELRRAAESGASRWGAFANDGRSSLTQARIGRVAYRSYVSLWERASDQVQVGAA